MNIAWDALADEAERWRDLARPLEFWWRDDDANRGTPEVARLLQLARESGVPLALAVIPQAVQADAFDAMAPNIDVLQHGADHRNRAAADQKKSEFPESESVDSAIGRLLSGRRQLEQVFGARALPVLAPPWNRFPATRVKHLVDAGYRGLSTFQARAAAFPAPGLRQANAHVDIIDWRAGRGFVGEARALQTVCAQLRARRLDSSDAGEPLGWLTHHAVHDEAAWKFMARLFERSHSMPGLRWLGAREIFAAQAA